MLKIKRACLSCFFLSGMLTVSGQDIFKGYENLFTEPTQYTVFHTTDAITIDGRASEKTWEAIPWTADFVDIEGSRKPLPALQTRMKMLRDENNLYIFAELEEPHVWATLTKHDAVIFHDNDFELFIDPDGDTHNYFEIEINALNTIFDLFLSKPYRNGGALLTTWNTENLKTAVQINGTLNNPADTDKGWTIEMAIPFAALRIGSHFHTAPPANTLWRVNFSRVQWDTEIVNGKYKKKTNASGKPLPEHNWVWSPQGLINMHYPERWGYIRFAGKDEKPGNVLFFLPEEETMKKYLWLLYYKQKEYQRSNKAYAKTLSALNIPALITTRAENKYIFKLEANTTQFTGTIIHNDKGSWAIDHNGKIIKK
ncbi:carbohydrate-binding family 9-like protein [Terrimonas sp.]|uniref:carbohydrate-binding family 9-like protein n=1 Tax=Terrimonas sp. TaxID=1914338 RepID=UPI000D50CDC6|nr:carbohydrate-binding family 9-like protein [Terrimonas sp.]PVD54268.1 carbohydrate-binding family 9-like protein [Terrimonas sp.]